MRIKTHLNNALYQITCVCFEHEHELGIAELQLVFAIIAMVFFLFAIIVWDVGQKQVVFFMMINLHFCFNWVKLDDNNAINATKDPLSETDQWKALIPFIIPVTVTVTVCAVWPISLEETYQEQTATLWCCWCWWCWCCCCVTDCCCTGAGCWSDCAPLAAELLIYTSRFHKLRSPLSSSSSSDNTRTITTIILGFYNFMHS